MYAPTLNIEDIICVFGQLSKVSYMSDHVQWSRQGGYQTTDS